MVADFLGTLDQGRIACAETESEKAVEGGGLELAVRPVDPGEPFFFRSVRPGVPEAGGGHFLHGLAGRESAVVIGVEIHGDGIEEVADDEIAQSRYG